MDRLAFFRIILLLFFTIPWLTSLGQDFDAYQHIGFEGKLPEDFWLSYKKKYKKALENIDEEDKKERKQAKATFYEQSI